MPVRRLGARPQVARFPSLRIQFTIVAPPTIPHDLHGLPGLQIVLVGVLQVLLGAVLVRLRGILGAHLLVQKQLVHRVRVSQLGRGLELLDEYVLVGLVRHGLLVVPSHGPRLADYRFALLLFCRCRAVGRCRASVGRRRPEGWWVWGRCRRLGRLGRLLGWRQGPRPRRRRHVSKAAPQRRAGSQDYSQPIRVLQR